MENDGIAGLGYCFRLYIIASGIVAGLYLLLKLGVI
jgi:hypothetical protein